MNYVTTTYQIGSGNIAQIAQTETTVPSVGRVRNMDATPKGCFRNQKGQTKATPAVNVANPFLKTRFLPRLEKEETVQATTRTAKLARDFYKSLSQLSQHYGIIPMDTSQFAYPDNIRISLWDTMKQLRKKVPCFEDLKIVGGEKKQYLQAEERCNIAHTLYYIPIVPIYLLLRKKETKNVAKLLLSVCSYLYRIVGISHYGDEYSYLSWQYEMIAEWVAYDEDGESTEGYFKELDRASWVGDAMQKKLGHIKNLEYFEKRIGSFKCKTQSDRDYFRLATEAYALFTQYPDTNCYRYATPCEVYGEDDDFDVVTMHNVISFCAETRGLIFDTLISSVNNELGEYGDAEEPAITKRFDCSAVENRNLDFENRLFTLLDDLVYLLNQS